ncbi:MAG TPA: response regulator [Caulobacteraceae bacterium]|jgi:DNA-binding response OmpR family regulator
MPISREEAGTFFYVLEEDLRILFVDDDPILREFAVVHLSTERAKVKVAGDGLEALQALSAESFDLVLLDLEMPRMDGFEFLEKLRCTDQFRTLPVIVVTGREDVAAIDRAYLAGATSFVVKPLNWRLISYQIRYVHRAFQTEQSLRQARARARADAAASHDAMRKLAIETARFMAVATERDPGLKEAGRQCADVINQLAGGAPEPPPLRLTGS